MSAAGGRIVLHVGAPKTGSTYIQQRLRANATALRTQGVYLPVLPAVAAMAGNAKLLATALMGEPSLSFRRAFPELAAAPPSPREVADQLLADWRPGGETLLLSAENFRPSHAGTLKTLLPQGAETSVVLFVRRQDLWMASYYNQLIKTRDRAGPPDAFAQEICTTEGERFCRPDWLAHHQAWQAAFGTVRVVCYDAVREGLFEAFLAAAGLPQTPGLLDVPRAQVGLDALQLAYLATLPADLSVDGFMARRRACEAVPSPEAPEGSGGLFSRAALAEISARYSASNAGLARRLQRPELEAQLQPREPQAAPTPLAELARSEAFRRFHAAVEARLAAPTPASSPAAA